MLDWLERFRNASGQSAAELTYGIAGCRAKTWQRWCDDRLALWPRGVPKLTRVGLASSRLGRKLDERESWFFVLRALCAKLDRSQEILVCSEGTAASPFVARAAELFGVSILKIHVPPPNISWESWFELVVSASEENGSDGVFDVFLSPAVANATQQPKPAPRDSTANLITTLPLADRALMAISQRVVVSHVRAEGNLHQLCRQRLVDSEWPTTSMQVALGSELTSRKIADELLGLGAIGWWLIRSASDVTAPEANSSIDSAKDATANPTLPEPTAKIMSMSDSIPWPYLVHCTRRSAGPWPEESEQQFVDQLVLETEDADHSAFGTLMRIVKTSRLLGRSTTIRGGFSVVSFADVTLDQLRDLRVYRPHRARWDFEPYGICIAKSWLEKRNARPVTYGDDATWETLPEIDRPFFQRATSIREDQTAIDWTVEREWRCVGNVNLDELAPSDAFLFVPSQAEAEQLARFSRWPVMVLN